MGDNADTGMTEDVGKVEDVRDGSTSSGASSPEPEQENYPQDNPQLPQKRKGGRKPIYATSEERKQRNRQAQAAFRERRTEYIKQLESTIKHHEETLQNLQNSHRNAADECLMLRYKNSLLERILLEKGIDVQAELRAKTGSPNLGPTRNAVSATTSPNQAPLQQRAIMNRQHQRRSLNGPTKPDGGHGLPMIRPDGAIPTRSPLSQPTPTSHLSSPVATATRSPNFMPQGTSVSPNFGPMPSHQQPPLRPQAPRSTYTTPMMGPQRSALATNNVTTNGMPGSSAAANAAASAINQNGTGAAPASYFSTTFTDHMSQLEQEYDEQVDLIEHEEASDQSAGPGPYPQTYTGNNMHSQTMPPPPTQNPPFTSPAALAPSEGSNVFNGMNHLFDPYDPMLDADPFGLSASMHFPTMYESR